MTTAMIKAILACDDSWGIGRNGDLPWPHNPADLNWFKQCTDGKTVVMGSATWDSLPVKPLPNRENIVMRSRVHTEPKEYLLNLAKLRGEIWIIGGAGLLSSVLDIVDELHFSRISGTYNCDTFLPVTRIEEEYAMVESGPVGNLYLEKYTRL
jgi:dihydrofolate reductase